MRTSTLGCLALLLSAPSLAASTASDGFKLIDADALQKRMSAEKVSVFDCNADDMRKSEGIVPGAQLISSYREYDARELPPDKKSPLVFYCANSH